MRINIEASAEELAEIAENGIAIGDLPEAIIVALDDCLSLPGYSVTVNEPSAIQAQLVAALKVLTERAMGFNVSGVYFGEMTEDRVLLDNACDALAAAGVQP